MKLLTLLLTLNLDSIGFLACNPSIGGTAKGHLVCEIDALGGEMGINADKSTIQRRMLNSSKGYAVQSLRVQADKNKYHTLLKKTLENQDNLYIRQGEASEIVVEDNSIDFVMGEIMTDYPAKANVLGFVDYQNNLGVAAGNPVVTINGGTFICDGVSASENYPWFINTHGNNEKQVTVNGGTYNANVAKQYWKYEVNLGEGLTTTNNGDGTWTVVPAVAAAPVATAQCTTVAQVKALTGENIPVEFTSSDAVITFALNDGIIIEDATGAMKETLESPLAKHLSRMGQIRQSVPALQKGQYSTEGCNGSFAYKRRYTDASTDSFALIAATALAWAL